MAPLPPRDQRHIRSAIYLVHILDFKGLTPDMRHDLAKRIRMVYTGDDGQEDRGPNGVRCLHTAEEMAEDGFGAYWLGSERLIPNKGDLSDYWVVISYGREFFRGAPSYTYIRDPVWRLCHRLISYNISIKGHAPEKYMFRHTEGRKSGAWLLGVHFIRRLAHHFGLVMRVRVGRVGAGGVRVCWFCGYPRVGGGGSEEGWDDMFVLQLAKAAHKIFMVCGTRVYGDIFPCVTKGRGYDELGPEEDEFEEEEDPQEEEDDMEVDIEGDENEPELTYPYEEVDPLNPPLPAFESELEDTIEVKNPIKFEDETVLASVHEVGESSTAPFLREDSDGLLPGLMRRDINSLFVRSSVEQGTVAMEKLVEKLGNAEDKVECKKLKKEREKAKFSNTFLRMQNGRVERDLYWTRVRAHEFYQEMIRRGFMFKERPNEAIDVPIEDEKSPSSESQGSPHDSYISCDECLLYCFLYDVTESCLQKGQDTAPAVRECTFAEFMKCNPAVFCGVEGDVELRRWFEKTESVFEISECAEGKKVKFVAAILEGPALTWWKTKVATMGLETVNQMPWIEMKQLITVEFFPIEEVQRMEHELWNLKVKEYDVVAYTQRFNELALMCPRMVEPERVKVDAYIRGLTDNIKGEVTYSKPVDLNEAVRMAQRNVRAMVTTPTDGRLPLCERCFTRYVRQCTIKCHKYGKVGHKARYYKEKSVATGANAQPVWTCYDCGKQGHTRNRCPKKIKQEEVREVHGRTYAIMSPLLNRSLQPIKDDSQDV
ncbi:putative reverse transcriptase domain-containing protein [Tanacetum coccineum]